MELRSSGPISFSQSGFGWIADPILDERCRYFFWTRKFKVPL